MFLENTSQLTYEIPFDHKHSLTNWRTQGLLSPSKLVYQKTKTREQSDFLGTEYVFRGIKCICKNVS